MFAKETATATQRERSSFASKATPDCMGNSETGWATRVSIETIAAAAKLHDPVRLSIRSKRLASTQEKQSHKGTTQGRFFSHLVLRH